MGNSYEITLIFIAFAFGCNIGCSVIVSRYFMVDRKLLKNPNGLILGTPGSGKSFSAKRELANCFLLTNDAVSYKHLAWVC